MEEFLGQGLSWWITVIDLPVLSALFWMIWHTRKESEAAVRKLTETLDVRTSQLREALLAFKLEVAKTYAATCELKDLEVRIVNHLLRIESKLDQTALKTEALKAGHKDI